ncbi:hypothetical protein V6N12_033403 [Hibiscus sabdariffa]|uniref:Uncharacterized protein n=1 Tax=Hibiscus sabdariffa TaxID=183260 RepID=A0ABR2BVT0_9ROSI
MHASLGSGDIAQLVELRSCKLSNKKLVDLLTDLVELWPDDEFDFRMVESDGRAGGLISIWDTNCFRAESEIVNSRFVSISGRWIQCDTLVN